MNLTKRFILLASLSLFTQVINSNERKCYVLHPPSQNILYTFSAVKNTDPNTGQVTYQNPQFLKEQKNIPISPNLPNLCIEGNVFPAIASFNELRNQNDNIALFYDQDGVYYPMQRKNNNYLPSDRPCYKCSRYIHKNHDLFTFIRHSYSVTRYNLCLNCASDEMEPKNVEKVIKTYLIDWRDYDNPDNDKFDENIINNIYEYAKPTPILPKHAGSRFKIIKLSRQKYSLKFKITAGVIIAGLTVLLIATTKIYLSKKKNIKASNSKNEKQKELEKTFLEAGNKKATASTS